MVFVFLALPAHETLAKSPDVPKPGETAGYAAKVGDRIISIDEYNNAVLKLHSGNRVGEALTGAKSFDKPDYRGFLDELIEKELVIGEALKLGLDKGEKFVEKVEVNRLNIFLEMMKKEDVVDKVKATKADVRRYYEDVESKELEKKLKEHKEKDTSIDVNVKKFDELSDDEKQGISSRVYDLKLKEVEAAFFKKVRNSASVKIYGKAVKTFSVEDIGTWDALVAKVEGSEITGRDLAIEMRRLKAADSVKEAVLERLVMIKAMDAAAVAKNYDKAPDVAVRLKRYWGDALVQEFKEKVIVPLIKVSDDDIKEYYNTNKEQFRESDQLYLKGIVVSSEAEAKSVISELKKGASFSFLAETLSMDKMSAKKGGDMGWVPANTLPEDVLKQSLKAKKGKILGPFGVGPGMYAIYEFRELKAGTYIPLERRDIRDGIRVSIGRKRFKDKYDTYVKELRSTVPVSINEDIFKNVGAVDEKK